MKDYPHIPRSRGQSFRAIPDATVFDKLDGSQIRVEWSGKRGIEWNKFGTRDQLLDPNDAIFSPAIGIFQRDRAWGMLGSWRGLLRVLGTTQLRRTARFTG